MSWTRERAKVAALTRSRDDDDPELQDARRNLRMARLADYIRKTVDAAPPLTEEQRDRLAVLLGARRPEVEISPRPLSADEAERLRAEQAEVERQADARREAERANPCAICGLGFAKHRFNPHCSEWIAP